MQSQEYIIIISPSALCTEIQLQTNIVLFLLLPRAAQGSMSLPPSLRETTQCFHNFTRAFIYGSLLRSSYSPTCHTHPKTVIIISAITLQPYVQTKALVSTARNFLHYTSVAITSQTCRSQIRHLFSTHAFTLATPFQIQTMLSQ